jgi:tetratricopeptide (TPR) repeat protein
MAKSDDSDETRERRPVSGLPQGYANIPEEDRIKAEKFFDYGRKSADTGNFDYAIELFLQGLAIDPENTDAHQQLRDISLKRKASGGKDLGMMAKMKLKKTSKEDKENLLNAEKLLAYNPGDTATMLALAVAAHRAGFYDTAMWIGKITHEANITAQRARTTTPSSRCATSTRTCTSGPRRSRRAAGPPSSVRTTWTFRRS